MEKCDKNPRLCPGAPLNRLSDKIRTAIMLYPKQRRLLQEALRLQASLLVGMDELNSKKHIEEFHQALYSLVAI